VIRAIARGREYLIAQQANDGSWSASLGVAEFRNGTTGLAILALLNSGMKEDDPPVAKGLKYLRGLRDDELESTSRQKPYELSLMLQALAAVKGKDRGRIAKLAELLVAYQKSNGGWRYDPPSGPGDDSWDNSVNQFALLGLREAAMTGYPVDQKVWLKAQELVLQNQIGGADAAGGNGWSYTPGEPNAYGGMTVAGMSSLIITSSMLQQDQNVGADGRIDCCGASGDERANADIEFRVLAVLHRENEASLVDILAQQIDLLALDRIRGERARNELNRRLEQRGDAFTVGRLFEVDGLPVQELRPTGARGE